MFFGNQGHLEDKTVRQVYEQTEVLRKPISGIVSGYHELPYLLVAPDESDTARSIQVSGTINVSPKFVITASQLHEAFADVFDPETFDQDIHGRVFSFANHQRKNYRVESQKFETRVCDERPQECLGRLEDDLARQEDLKTALVYSPRFSYYPVSIDRFVNEIVEREFRV